MRPFIVMLALFAASGAANEYPNDNAEIKTTFITITKPCSTTESSATPQNANTYTPEVQEESPTHIYTEATFTPPVEHESKSTYATTVEIYYPPAIKQATPTPVPTYADTYLAPVPCTCPTEAALVQSVYLPSLPLKTESLQAFDSLLSIIISIPDSILDAGDEAVTTFYTNLSTCVGSKGETLKESLVEFGSIFQQAAGNIEEEISKGVKDAGDFIGGLIKDGEDAVDGVLSPLPDAIKSALGPIASGILHLPDSIGNLFGRDSKREPPPVLESLAEILSGIDSLRACLASAIATNTVFEVAQCAASIVSVASPAEWFLRAKILVSAAGGQKSVLRALAAAKSFEDVGKGVLDVFTELSGIADVVKDCKFIVE